MLMSFACARGGAAAALGHSGGRGGDTSLAGHTLHIARGRGQGARPPAGDRWAGRGDGRGRGRRACVQSGALWSPVWRGRDLRRPSAASVHHAPASMPKHSRSVARKSRAVPQDGARPSGGVADRPPRAARRATPPPSPEQPPRLPVPAPQHDRAAPSRTRRCEGCARCLPARNHPRIRAGSWCRCTLGTAVSHVPLISFLKRWAQTSNAGATNVTNANTAP